MYLIEQQAEMRRAQFIREAEYARLAKTDVSQSQGNTSQSRAFKQSLKILWGQTLQQIVELYKPQAAIVPNEQCLECAGAT